MKPYYLDNSPTIGFVNDTAGAQGRVTGFLVNHYNVPIPGLIRSSWLGFYWPFFKVHIDSSGWFEFNTIAYKWPIIIEGSECRSQLRQMQIWPDSTIELNIVLQPEPEYYQSYFPLQIGNSWTYTPTSGSQFTNTIKDTVSLNDHWYYNLANSFFRFDSLGNVIQYRDGKDTLKYPLALAIKTVPIV